jgi:Flp pilus assembly protein TadD
MRFFNDSSARRFQLLRYIATAGLLSCTFAGAAFANSLPEISALLKQEKFPQALEAVDKYLANKPKDAQGRFLKGIALTEMKRLDAATAVFQKLTEDYPELPEPYNNLAVIYAQQKQYEKAKAALEMAIRTHPAYATAHENLGDIYARLASQAYDKALQLDSSNSSAQNKLSMIQDLMTGSPTSARPAGDGRKPAAPAATPAVAVAASPAAATKPTPAVTAAASTQTPSPASKPAPTAETAKPASAEAPKETPKATTSGDQEAVANAVSAWAAAWSKKDVKTYLAAYAKDFKTPGGVARSAWETERRQRIDKPGTIEVTVKSPQISIEGERATVRFRQIYRWNNQDRSANKRLDLAKRDGRWQIVQESVGG